MTRTVSNHVIVVLGNGGDGIAKVCEGLFGFPRESRGCRASTYGQLGWRIRAQSRAATRYRAIRAPDKPQWSDSSLRD
jgi:hypothetical protein